jgi:hypothetical protein
MPKREVIQALDFGHITAEAEKEHIAGLFVKTAQWNAIEAGGMEIISGNKGFGKSTIYQLMQMNKAKFAEQKKVTILLAENLTEDAAFAALTERPQGEKQLDEKEFEAFWKLYFLTIVGNALNQSKQQDQEVKTVVDSLRSADLIGNDFSLKTILLRVLKYVTDVARNAAIIFETDSKGDPKVSIRIYPSEISAKFKNKGVVDVGELFHLVNKYLEQTGRRIWIMLDRLDGVFGTDEELELVALRTLLRVYASKFQSKRLGLRLFLRADTLNALAKAGAKEMTHALQFKTDLRWEKGELSKLIALRLASAPKLLQLYGVTTQVIEQEASRSALINNIFAGTFGPGTKAFTYILENLEDGNGQVTPRDLILFFKKCQEFELSRLDNGGAEQKKGLFHQDTALKAFKEVASVKLTQSIFAEHPTLVKPIERLPAIPAPTFSAKQLAKVWGVKTAEAAEKAAKLTQLGILATGNAGQGYHLPKVYKRALNITKEGAL